MAWQLTVGSDLTLPHVQSPRPLPVRVINAYVGRVLSTAERDPRVAEQFAGVAALQQPFSRLFRPSTALRVLLGNRRLDRSSATDAAPPAAVLAADQPSQSSTLSQASPTVQNHTQPPPAPASGRGRPGRLEY
jgi:hypothetical protein